MNDILVTKLRESAILTTSYVYYDIGSLSSMPVGRFNQLVVYVKFTKGSLTTAEFVVEVSPNGTDWFAETSSSISAGTDTVSVATHQVGATGNFRYLAAIKDPFVRIGIKGTGTTTSSLAEIWVAVGTV